MLKKLLLIALVPLIILSVFSGCGKKSSDKDTEGDIDLTEKSIEFAREMAGGSFENTVEAFDSTMKSALTAEQLSQAWSETVSNIGNFKSVYDSEYESSASGRQVSVILEYELSGLKVLFSYDNTGKINGLWITYHNIPAQEDNPAGNIEIEIGNDPYKLSGILRMPTENSVNPPVVILVHGSGSSDYDETIGANKPFKDLADGLSQKGIATLRYNKRFYQYPQSAAESITIQDEVIDDVNSAIEFVKGREELKGSKIYILGHSMGGMLAPYIASINPEVAGIIIMAGSPRRLEDIILDQNIAAIDAMADKTEEEKEQLLQQVREQIDIIKGLTDEDAETVAMGVPASYWLSLGKIDTPEICSDLSIPMLIMQGSADFQVLADVDYKMWQDILDEKTNVEFKLYEELNHLFMPTNGKKDISEYSIKSEVDEQVIWDIAQWINSR
ncbi:MAG: alpha/beta fold hydrolase [Clostridiales bacterium]|jgi:dienelactone hydrolase|nr:alpha/beta fold hydrolase [Clostridiales bacterium]